jgi:Flp pilus assembly pilin Flp
MRRIMNAIDRFIIRQKDELGELSLRRAEGQALVEYAIIIGLIAVLCVVLITTLGKEVSDYFSSIVAAL